nr:reverse transcriptase domain-containing protein [Tanacetum cinerariifolium]
MRTRSQSRNNFPQQEASPAIFEPLRIELPFLEDQFLEDPPEDPPEVLMANNQTMAELLQAPTEGYEDAISKVRQSRAKAFVAKVSTSYSTLAISFEVVELKDMVRALLLDKKNQSSAPAPSPTPTLVKAVELNCVTYGSAHSYQNCPATNENVYRDNIQEYVSRAAAANYNQGNTGFRPQMITNQIRPPGFPPVQTHQNSQNNFNWGNNFNQNRGGNFNQSNFNQGGNFNQGQLHRPQVNQPPAYQAPIPQTQSVSKTDFESYVKANDAVLRNMQNRGSGTLPSNTITNPKEDLKGITTRSSVAYQGPTIPTPSKVVKQGTEVTKEQVQTLSSQSTAPVQPSVVQYETQTPVSEPVVAPVSTSMPNLKVSIPYPLRRDNERRRDQANDQIEKFYEIFKYMSFKISFTDALILMPKFASTLKALIRNKEKLSEMARTPINEHYSAVILNKLPRKLGDPGKFLIPCEFPGMDERLALADLGASINLMPLFLWQGLSLPELTPTCMTLELADRSVSKPIGIAKDVSVKTGRALIDVHNGELTLCIKNKAITYNMDQTSRYSANYNQMMANKINVIDMACEEYSQEVLDFFDVIASGNPTPYDDLIISITSPTLTPFGDIDFLLFEEADAFLAILNSEPLPPLPNHKQYMPSFKKELKVCEAKTVKASVDEPPDVELKDLPPHIEYTFLEGDNKLPVIIAKELGNEEKSALIKVLKSHKRAIAWKLSDIQGINLEFCTHKILMEEDYKPAVQHQIRVNPKIHDVIKKEVEKLLDAGLIYPIFDSPWASPVHCVPKKGGFTVVENEENELIPTRLVTRWRVCIDYRKLNEATRKDHFPLPFMDQMLERLAGNEYYCFLDGFSGYFQFPIDPRDQEKTTFTCPYGTFAYRRMLFGLCNAPGTFQRCMLAIFHDMVEKTMEVFTDDFSIFGNSFENCLSHLDKMLQRCEDTNLCLNWEKSHFMVKEGTVLGHKISKNEIKGDKAKVDVIAKLPHPTTVKGAENLADDHLSRLENPYENVLDPKEINETFPLEKLSTVTFRGDSSAPWFADFANYHAGNFIVKVIWRCVHGKEALDILKAYHNGPTRGHYGANLTAKKEKFHNVKRYLKTPSKFVKSLTFGALTLWARYHVQEGTNIFSWPSIICRNALKRKRSPPMTPELFASSLNLSTPDLVPLELS